MLNFFAYLSLCSLVSLVVSFIAMALSANMVDKFDQKMEDRQVCIMRNVGGCLMLSLLVLVGSNLITTLLYLTTM